MERQLSPMGEPSEHQRVHRRECCAGVVQRDRLCSGPWSPDGAWPKQQRWLAETLERLHEILGPIIRELKVDDEEPEDGDDTA